MIPYQLIIDAIMFTEQLKVTVILDRYTIWLGNEI